MGERTRRTDNTSVAFVLDPGGSLIQRDLGSAGVIDDALHALPLDAPLLVIGRLSYDEVADDDSAAEDIDALDTRILAQADAGNSADRASAWGRWDALPGTASEAEAIGGLAQVSLGVKPHTLGPTEVTRASLAEAVRGKRFVHIATHGWFMPANVRSIFDLDERGSSQRLMGSEATVTGFAPLSLCGLVMSGANTAESSAELTARLLTAQELSEFDLGACELAVRLASETNVGVSRTGQGIQSLRTVLHQAGVKSSMTLLWRVDDAATRDLMTPLFRPTAMLHRRDAVQRQRRDEMSTGGPSRS